MAPALVRIGAQAAGVRFLWLFMIIIHAHAHRHDDAVTSRKLLEISSSSSSSSREPPPDVCRQQYASVPMGYRPHASPGSSSSKPVLCLTFDDGPEAVGLPAVLDVLKRHGAPAAFFLNTYSNSSWLQPFNAPQNLAAVRRALAEGHEVGSHAAAHLHLPQLAPEEARLQLDWAIGNITAATGAASVPLFRAPYGDGFMQSGLPHLPAAVAAAAPRSLLPLEQLWQAVHERHVHVGWGFSGKDYEVVGGKRQGCADRVFEAYGPPITKHQVTGVVLMHSTMNAMGACPEGLDRLMHHWRQNGYAFVSVSALVQQIYGGATPEEVVARAAACAPRHPGSNPLSAASWVRSHHVPGFRPWAAQGHNGSSASWIRTPVHS